MQNNSFMCEKEKATGENPESQQAAETAVKVDFCMAHYQPYIRHDFNKHHLSVITNLPVSDIEFYFCRSARSFNQFIDEWRVKYAKNLMNSGKVRDKEIKTIGSLSGFSSARNFRKAYKQIEGISPETYLSQINKSKSS